MPTRLELTTPPVRVWRLLLLALATTFIAEYLIMKCLPFVLPVECGDTCEAIVDSCLLTLFVAPALWVIAVRPIQRLAESRMLFLRRSLTTQEEERQRITRDIHDGIGQSLTSLLLGLRVLEESTKDVNVSESVKAIRALGAGIHDDLRRIVRGLRPAILDQLGLVAAVERLVEDVNSSGLVEAQLNVVPLNFVRLSPELESTAYRIVQEAMSNAVRHASAKRIDVTLRTTDRDLILIVADDGIGFEASSAFQNSRISFGLMSIRERAMICGGTAEIQTSVGSGTTVVASLPLSVRSIDND